MTLLLAASISFLIGMSVHQYDANAQTPPYQPNYGPNQQA